MNLKYVVPVLVFLIFVVLILLFAVSKVPEESKEELSFVIQNDPGKMKTFEVNTNKQVNRAPDSGDNTERFNRNYLEYLDRQQEARDKTFLR